MRVVVRRDRHDWGPGYFDPLRGQRIPFPHHGDDEPGSSKPMTGILTGIIETEDSIALTFVEPLPEGGEQ